MREIFGGFSGLKFQLIVIASFIVIAGVTWNAARNDEKGTKTRAVAASEVQSSARSVGARRYDQVAKKIDPWALAGLSMGISFIPAIIFGSLMRVSFKRMVMMLLIIIGVSFALDYKGVVEPFWGDYFSSMSDVKKTLIAQTQSTTAFLIGHFPPFVSAVIGFGCGLKR